MDAMATQPFIFIFTLIYIIISAFPSNACPTACLCFDNKVNCYGKNLKIIPDNLPKDALTIDLQSNDIERINDEFYNTTSVTEIQLRFNKISHISQGAFSNLPHLNLVNLESNLLTTLTPGIFKNVPKLRFLDLTQNQLANVDGAFDELSSLIKLVLTKNKLETLTTKALQPLTSLLYLMADDNHISSVDANAFHTLKELAVIRLNKNPLRNIDGRLTENVQLSHLELSQCQLQNFPKGLPWQTRHLNLSHNDISTISYDTFWLTRFLGVVDLNNNNITSIAPGAFTPTPHLQQIWLNGNSLTIFPSPLPASITTMYAENNLITEISNSDFPENSQMTLLSLKGNKLKDIGPFTFGNLKSLDKLYLGGNRLSVLKDRSFAGMRNLTILELDNNPITHIETRFAAGLSSLKALGFSFIEDTEPLMQGNFFRDIPYLQSLKLRSTPTLANNILRSIETLKTFYNLQELDLRDNHLQVLETDLPRFFPNLNAILLAGNDWLCDTHLLWLHDWINRRPEIFTDVEEVQCGKPMHLAGAIISYLPFEAFHYTTTTTATTSITEFNVTEFNVTEDWSTDASSGDEGQITITSTSKPDTTPVLTTSKEFPKSATSGKDIHFNSMTEENTRELIEEITTEGFITTEVFITAIQDTNFQITDVDENVTMIYFSTVLQQEGTTEITITDLTTEIVETSGQKPVTSSDIGKPTTKSSTSLLSTTKESITPEPKQARNTSDDSSSTKQTIPSSTTKAALEETTENNAINSVTAKQETKTASITAKNETETATMTSGNRSVTTPDMNETFTLSSTSSQRQFSRSPSATGDSTPQESATSERNVPSHRINTEVSKAGLMTTTSSTSTSYYDPELDSHSWPTNFLPDKGVGSSQNRIPSFGESPANSQTVTVATSVTVMALIIVLISAALVLRHRKKIKRAYFRAFNHTVEASDTAFVLSDQDDTDMLPGSKQSTLGSRSNQRSRSNSDLGKGDQSMETFVWEEC